jgi:hypothetical protein
MEYSYAAINFFNYAYKFNVPTDIFLRDAHVVQYVIVDWVIFSRSTEKGRTDNVDGDRMAILSATLGNRVSGLADFVRQYGGHSAPELRSPDLKAILKTLDREDEISRGQKDSWTRLPLGAEFHAHLLNIIPAHVPERLVKLYRVAALFEYTMGTRVKEVLVDTRAVLVPNLMPDVECAVTHPSMLAIEASACVHSIKNRDVQLVWIKEKKVLYAHEGAQFPQRRPDYITLFQPHTKNWRSGAPPSTLWANNHPPHAAPYCAVTETWELLKADRTRAGEGFFLLGAHDSVLRQCFKATARHVGFDEKRTMLCGARKGCASATTLSDGAREIAAKMRDQHQHWRSDMSGAYVYGDVADGLEKTIQLYDMRTSSIAKVIARFMRPFSST